MHHPTTRAAYHLGLPGSQVSEKVASYIGGLGWHAACIWSCELKANMIKEIFDIVVPDIRHLRSQSMVSPVLYKNAVGRPVDFGDF